MEIIPGFFVSLSGYSAVVPRGVCGGGRPMKQVIDRKEFKR